MEDGNNAEYRLIGWFKLTVDRQVYFLNVFQALRHVSANLHSIQSRPVSEYVMVFSADSSESEINERC